MATIQSQLVLTDGMSSVLRRMNSALLTCIDSFEQMQSTSTNQIDTMVLRETRASLTELNSELNTSVESQESVSEAASQTDAVVKKLRESFLKLAAAAGLTFSAKEIIGLADTYTETQARLNLITGDLEKTKSLQDAIMDSANRSRAAYQSTADAVSKMGLMAKDGARVKAIKKDWSCVDRIDTYDVYIVISCFVKKPETDILLLIKGV